MAVPIRLVTLDCWVPVMADLITDLLSPVDWHMVRSPEFLGPVPRVPINQQCLMAPLSLDICAACRLITQFITLCEAT
jgi:hypothetical protein